MSTFWTFNNFIYVWLTTGAGPGLYTDVLATEVYIKAFIDGRLGYSVMRLGSVAIALLILFSTISAQTPSAFSSRRPHIPFTMFSVIFLASPSSIIVLSR